MTLIYRVLALYEERYTFFSHNYPDDFPVYSESPNLTTVHTSVGGCEIHITKDTHGTTILLQGLVPFDGCIRVDYGSMPDDMDHCEATFQQHANGRVWTGEAEFGETQVIADRVCFSFDNDDAALEFLDVVMSIASQ